MESNLKMKRKLATISGSDMDIQDADERDPCV